MEPTHIAVTTAEVEVVSAADIAGRGAPIEAVLANVETRRTEAVTRSRKKNIVAVWSGYFVAVHATLGGPLPSTFVS